MTYIETFVPGAFEIEFTQIFEKLEISVRRTTSDRRGKESASHHVLKSFRMCSIMKLVKWSLNYLNLGNIDKDHLSPYDATGHKETKESALHHDAARLEETEESAPHHESQGSQDGCKSPTLCFAPKVEDTSCSRGKINANLLAGALFP